MQQAPGQTNPNELEAAILRRLADEHGVPALAVKSLHVLSREFTGVGSYTNFLPGEAIPGLSVGPLGLNALISVAGVPTGLGAILFVESGRPKLLEIYAFGEEPWDGTYASFSIAAAA